MGVISKERTDKRINAPLPGVVAGIAVTVIWTGWILVTRHGVATDLTTWDIVAIRYLSAAAMSVPILVARWRRNKLTLSRGIVLAATSGSPYALLAIGAAIGVHRATLAQLSTGLFLLLPSH